MQTDRRFSIWKPKIFMFLSILQMAPFMSGSRMRQMSHNPVIMEWSWQEQRTVIFVCIVQGVNCGKTWTAYAVSNHIMVIMVWEFAWSKAVTTGMYCYSRRFYSLQFRWCGMLWVNCRSLSFRIEHRKVWFQCWTQLDTMFPNRDYIVNAFYIYFFWVYCSNLNSHLY